MDDQPSMRISDATNGPFPCKITSAPFPIFVRLANQALEAGTGRAQYSTCVDPIESAEYGCTQASPDDACSCLVCSRKFQKPAGLQTGLNGLNTYAATPDPISVIRPGVVLAAGAGSPDLSKAAFPPYGVADPLADLLLARPVHSVEY